jgi:ABC-2 type transport system permease protein
MLAAQQPPTLAQETPVWRSHLRILLAVAWRQWLIFLRYPLNAIFKVVQPLIWLTPIYFLGLSFQTDEGNIGFAGFAGTTDYMSFILVGALISSYISAVFWGMGYALKEEMDSGVLESNWMTPVPRVLFLVGNSLANVFTTTLINVALLAVAAWMFGFRITGNVWTALAVLAPMLVALYGFGFAFAAVVLRMRDANTLVDVSDFLVSILAGSQFPVTVLPRPLLVISLALPLTYGFDAVRGILLDAQTLMPIGVEIAILIGFMLVMIPLGVVIYRRVEQRMTQAGTIGMH